MLHVYSRFPPSIFPFRSFVVIVRKINSNKRFVLSLFPETNWRICFISFEKEEVIGCEIYLIFLNISPTSQTPKGHSISDISMPLTSKNLCKVYLLSSFIDM